VACWCGILAVFLPYSAAILNAAHNTPPFVLLQNQVLINCMETSYNYSKHSKKFHIRYYQSLKYIERRDITSL
jgi:hypothetical protein